MSYIFTREDELVMNQTSVRLAGQQFDEEATRDDLDCGREARRAKN
jgi:hypothetical protein